MNEIRLLWHFLYDFEGNFMCPAFLQFCYNVIHRKSVYKNGFRCCVFFVCLSMFVMSYFLLKISDLKDILC